MNCLVNDSRDIMNSCARGLLNGMYTLHSHTEFCDGRAPMDVMARAAFDAGMMVYGFTPHSPLPIESPCNMKWEDVDAYLKEADRLKHEYDCKMGILTGMEVDFLSDDFGPHSPEIQAIPLDYRIGSVHFVPNQRGELFDCDGSVERFARNLKEHYDSDLRYVVERFFDQTLRMIELGGFEIIGHFDKIIGNATPLDDSIEQSGWYRRLVEKTISALKGSEIFVEINTKALDSRNRFYPDPVWWPALIEAKLPLLVNSDAHYPELINAGRPDALSLLYVIKTKNHMS